MSAPRTQGGRPFTVFTPFRRRWRTLERRTVHRAPRELAPLPSGLRKGRLPAAPDGGALPEPHREPGEPAARAALAAWLDGPIDGYAEAHDDLAARGTSGLSPYLRWGCLSAAECEARAARRGGAGAVAWIRQLCWRDFFAHVLLAHPANARVEHQERYRDLEWADDGEAFDAWRAGRTGYPLVDAAMRQLARTGWMHNRARLVAGSFLNPVLQQRRFDPRGDYVRRWVPELRAVPDERLAEPWAMSDGEQAAAGCVIGRDYPAPIVDHAAERRRAIERYRAAGA